MLRTTLVAQEIKREVGFPQDVNFSKLISLYF